MARRPRWRPAVLSALLLAGLLQALLSPGVGAQETEADAEDDTSPPRPPDLVILQDRATHQGQLTIGVFSIRADPADDDLWRVDLWQQWPDRVETSTDMVRCSRDTPTRVTGLGQRMVVRELNPGGLITPSNRLDHMVWWAVCAPEQAGRDPATLQGVAREMGYSGNLPERIEILPALPR